MFIRILCVIGLLTITFLGCGTDVKPSTISSVFSSEAIMDDVSNCIVDPPIIDENDNTVTITADNDCLISIVERIEDPVSISDIVKSPFNYIGKEVTFTAKVERYLDGYFDERGRYLPYQIQLDTPQPEVIFIITYYDTQYDGGIPLVDAEYEFTVFIHNVSYQSDGNVYITASDGVIEGINTKHDDPLIEPPVPFEDDPIEPEPPEPQDEPLDAE